MIQTRLKMYNKIKLMIQLKIFGGLLYLQCILKKIQLAKELFMIELMSGQEVNVPKDLSQSNLPYSYRYYDPILLLIKGMMPQENREYFALKKGLDFKFS
jgi:hypothetical protein